MIRSLYWLHYLRFFPPGAPSSSWPALVRECRRRYDRCLERSGRLTARSVAPNGLWKAASRPRGGCEQIMDFEVKQDVEKMSKELTTNARFFA